MLKLLFAAIALAGALARFFCLRDPAGARSPCQAADAVVQNLVGIDAEELRQAFHDNAEGLFLEMRIGDERSQGDEVNETNQTPPIARTFSPLQKQMLECVLKEEFRSRVSAVAGLGSFGHSHVCRCRGTA